MANTNQQIDVLIEKTGNIERTSNAQLIRTHLNEAMKQLAAKEPSTRKFTFTFNKVNSLQSLEEITDELENIKDPANGPIMTWTDKNNAYVKLAGKAERDNFFKTLKNAAAGTTIAEIYSKLKRNTDGTAVKLTRKPARIEIQNVKNNIPFDAIKLTLEDIAGSQPESITDIKEGKTIQNINARVIMFKATAKAIETIFKTLGGVIQVKLPHPKDGSVARKTNLYPRINTKPFMCRECFFIGSHHECKGKACANCGSCEHKAQACTTKTKFCTNCKKGGHRARDTHCPKYLNEIAKEIQRIDIPLEALTDVNLRSTLIKNLQLN